MKDAMSMVVEPERRTGTLVLLASRGQVHCFELVARDGVFACVTHRYEYGGRTVAGSLYIGDESEMREFKGPIYMGGSQPAPSPALDVTLEPSMPSDYRRHPRGWRAREEARRKGLVDRTDYSTDAFFTEEPERRYDQGQAPLFMRRPDAAAMRCGDTLHGFTPLSPERTLAFLEGVTIDARRTGTLQAGLAVDSVVVSTDAAPTGKRSRKRPPPSDPCVLLFGEPTPAQKRHTRAQYEDWSASLEVEKLPDIRWCLDQEGSEAGEDIEAMWQIEERMGARVARDAAELARRLHAIRPDIEPIDPFVTSDRSVAYPASSLKGLYKWWSRLGYEDRPEAVRLEVMTRLFGTTPTHLRLENHTSLGERFATEFRSCYSRSGVRRASRMR